MGFDSEIREAVDWDAPYVDIDDNIFSVIQKMAENNMSAVLVKQNEIVIGLVTDMDVMDLVNRNPDIRESKVSECMTACDLITDEGTRNPCIQLDHTESVELALDILSTAGMHNLVVTGGEEGAVGIVSAHRLLKLAVS